MAFVCRFATIHSLLRHPCVYRPTMLSSDVSWILLNFGASILLHFMKPNHKWYDFLLFDWTSRRIMVKLETAGCCKGNYRVHFPVFYCLTFYESSRHMDIFSLTYFLFEFILFNILDKLLSYLNFKLHNIFLEYHYFSSEIGNKCASYVGWNDFLPLAWWTVIPLVTKYDFLWICICKCTSNSKNCFYDFVMFYYLSCLHNIFLRLCAGCRLGKKSLEGQLAIFHVAAPHSRNELERLHATNLNTLFCYAMPEWMRERLLT